jgi:Cofilin/tropomyosin-type actin-binding protein
VSLNDHLLYFLLPTVISNAVETIGTRDMTFQDVKKLLPFTDSRFCVFDQDIKTADGRDASKLWLISWFPVNSTPRSKMAYAVSVFAVYPVLPVGMLVPRGKETVLCLPESMRYSHQHFLLQYVSLTNTQHLSTI